MRREVALLGDIVAEADVILAQLEKVSFDDVQADPILSRGILHSLMIIGEAANRMPPEVCARYSEVPWRDLAGLRHRIVHDYSGIDFELIWGLITTRLATLRNQIAGILDTDYPSGKY
ncbi:MAG: DUF86 domain-containing protein [Candidatus Solibacter usitatus]|nr:DUF86 domain-containing protein [Candidatus Solibacter usitatus]